ncbi:MAG: hypothetical protein Q9M28_08235 [Mariprofundaceae bacterium]|nr:hypothetical protein [Mariprofundaceae bacterium]
MTRAQCPKTHPKKKYKYTETGFEEGGQFRPHKTHRNGLSVDFMGPMLNAKGESVHLPTHYFNKLGYAIELDQKGRYEDMKIDYEAMAAHIVSLHKQARMQKVKLWRVIFDPKLQRYSPNLSQVTLPTLPNNITAILTAGGNYKVEVYAVYVDNVSYEQSITGIGLKNNLSGYNVIEIGFTGSQSLVR